MRRKPKDKPTRRSYTIHECKPWFFWRKCCVCGEEVRRETVYEIDITWHMKKVSLDLGVVCRSDSLDIDTYHFCSKCCASMAAAEDTFIRYWLPLYQ